MWVLMIALASCQDVAEQPGPIEPVTFAPEYPSLHTVPARPQLTYTVEQKRAIVDMLIADRVNARYTDGVVRYRAGLSSEPPPPAPALAAVPESELRALGAAPAITPPVGARPAPATIPETEFQQEKDSLDSFMQDMVNGRTRSQGPANPAPAGRPDANAAPLGTSRAEASASELIAQPAAYPPRSQVVVLAMPPDPASLPPPRPAPPLGSLEAQDLASLGAQHKAVPPPPGDAPILAERAPGVVWGTPEMASAPADGPLAMLADASADAGLPPHADLPRGETNLAVRAPGVVWGMPEMAPAPADGPQAMLADAAADAELPPHADLPRAETNLAGGAPGVVWGIPDTAPAPTVPPTSEIAQVETTARAGTMVGVSQEPAPAAPPGLRRQLRSSRSWPAARPA